MGRLIDEDDVMEMLTQVELSYTSIPMIEAKTRLRDIPSVYDLDKIVEQLKGKTHLNCYEPATLGYDKGIMEAIKIVKAGGANE